MLSFLWHHSPNFAQKIHSLTLQTDYTYHLLFNSHHRLSVPLVDKMYHRWFNKKVITVIVPSSGIRKYIHWLPVEQHIRLNLTCWPTTLSVPLSLLISTPFLITTLQHVVYALQTPTCCLLLVFALPLPPVVLVLQPPQSGTHSHLAFVTLRLPIPFVGFLKLTASSRPLAPPSDSTKCLRFAHWWT